MNLPEEFYFFAGMVIVALGILALDPIIDWLTSRKETT